MKQSSVKIRAPHGYFFSVAKDRYEGKLESVTIELRLSKHRDQIVGTVALCHYDDIWYETHSDLNPEHHGKGLGTLLYAKAIQWGTKHGLKVRSSGCSSSMALRVWRGKTLRKYCKVRTRYTRYDGKPKSEYDIFFARAK